MYYSPSYPIQRTLKNRAAQTLLFVILIFATTGCATLTREYGKKIFTSQHRAMSAITEAIQAAELENPEIIDELYAAEDDLNKACGPLQKVGSLSIVGETVGFFLKLTSIFSFDKCEEKTKEIEKLLWRLDPETARYFLDEETDIN